MPGHRGASRSRALSAVELVQRLLHLVLGADDADVALHHLLQRHLDRERVLAAARGRLERLQRVVHRTLHLAVVDADARVLA